MEAIHKIEELERNIKDTKHNIELVSNGFDPESFKVDSKKIVEKSNEKGINLNEYKSYKDPYRMIFDPPSKEEIELEMVSKKDNIFNLGLRELNISKYHPLMNENTGGKLIWKN